MKTGKEGLEVDGDVLDRSSEELDVEPGKKLPKGKASDKCVEPCQSMFQLCKRHPLSLCGPPVVLFCLVVALCVFGAAFVKRDPNWNRLETINGPLPLTVGGRQALIARYPVFIEDVDEDEDWNNPNNQTRPTGCTDLCYNETTRTKFWGFTAAFFYAASILSGEDQRLQSLVEDGYYYRLAKIDDSNNEKEIIVENGFNGKVGPHAGRHAGLLLLLLVSHQKAAMLLEEQLITNKVLEQTNNRLTETKCVLEAEKQQREALLGRQYDLIACFEQRGSKHTNSGRGSDVSSSLSSSMADKQQATLGRIAAVRRAIDEDRGQAPHPNDDIRTFELLGEGTFGKVHRGLWRQTVVAIKIILLPANMSGAEKREKMVVWEAAISSSLSHPNIVQTYTYSIKPVKESRDNHRASLEDRELGSAVVFLEEPSRSNAQGSLLNKSSEGTDSSGGGAIHSFEVGAACKISEGLSTVSRLVLNKIREGAVNHIVEVGAACKISEGLSTVSKLVLNKISEGAVNHFVKAHVCGDPGPPAQAVKPTFAEILQILREMRSKLPFPTSAMPKIARLSAHPVRANVLQKLTEDARIDEGAEEGEDNPEGDDEAATKAPVQAPASPRRQLEKGPSGKSAREAPNSPDAHTQARQQQSVLGQEDTKHPGDGGRDSGGGRGGAGVGTQEEPQREGSVFPGAVVLDMREVAEGMRAVGDRSSCSGVDGVRGCVDTQASGGGPGGDGQEREGQTNHQTNYQGGGGAAARRKSYPGPQYKGSFAEQQQVPAMQSGAATAAAATALPHSHITEPQSPATPLRSHSSRSRSSHNCVLVIGEDSDEMYPENSRGQGEGESSAQSFTSTKVEVSGIRSKVRGG
ncbi:hypothetical protein DUNSADRAFT_13261 [Dunaliella salina]|uniref:Serine-threonine/tyrosine-protein kinase catalytic domain-containing protein n=1 Tax=Dunaliella salina TaxID=3046 RepID=A0ABQ7G9S1_DUNSA|nr:hypothetical protein DUNSADRAFT_13261 [Dunaliella salina]|eukprot:KAF5831354.1 hypothetical protein DUNSADRAFT_13261 [Dunaliella salina]